MSNTTRTNTPTASAASGLPRRRQQTEWFPRREPVELNVAVEQDPERARKFGNEIQAAGHRADLAGLRARNEYARGLRAAASRFAAGVIGDDSPTGTWVRGMVQEIGEQADDIEHGRPVPERSDIRPEVPTEQSRG